MALVNLLVSILVCLSVVIYYLLRRQQQKLVQHGIPVAENPHLLLGNVRGIGRKEHSCVVLQRLYWHFKKRGLKLAGFMNFFQPAVLVVDPEVTKSVLVKDFNVFRDRGIYVDPVGDPLTGGLFNLEAAHWKVMRQKLTPMFTSGKMKYMFGTVLSVAQEMKNFVANNCHREDLEIKSDILQRFTMDVIGSVAFGIECNTINNPETEFSRMGNKSFEFSTFRLFKFFIGGFYRNFSRRIGLKLVDEDVSRFFMQLVKTTVEFRENSGERRNDFMDLLLEIKNKGKFSSEPNSGGEGLTMEEVAAQCFVFFNAGFETSSTTMNFCLYEMAMNQDVQEKLRKEIVQKLVLNNGELTYETMLEMDFLDRVIDETLRKYPPIDNLTRCSDVAYTVPGTNYTLPAGSFLQIPVYAMHHDPEYFPKPERFDPDRFLPETVKSRHPYVYLPFGEGPRNCIGLRFGLMQTKVGLITLLSNFRFFPGSRTPKKLEFDPAIFVLAPKTGMYLKIDPLKGRN